MSEGLAENEIGDDPPEGFARGRHHGPFSRWNGPFYHNRSHSENGETAIARQGFRVKARHCNRAGFVHGGMMMALADSSMGRASAFAAGHLCLTAQMGGRFLSSAREGMWVEARAQTRRLTQSLAFCDAVLYARAPDDEEEKPIFRASGVFKRLRATREVSLKNLRRDAEPRAHEHKARENAEEINHAPPPPPPENFRLRRPGSPFLESNGPFFEAIEIKDGVHRLRLPILPRHCNHMSLVHGGMMMTLADSSLIRPLAREKGGSVLTAQLEARFVASARLGDWVEARSWRERVTRNLAFCGLEIWEKERLLLLGSGIFRLPNDSS